MEKTFAECYIIRIGGWGMPNFDEKAFVGGSQMVKSMKVFSLESFPLCGM